MYVMNHPTKSMKLRYRFMGLESLQTYESLTIVLEAENLFSSLIILQIYHSGRITLFFHPRMVRFGRTNPYTRSLLDA